MTTATCGSCEFPSAVDAAGLCAPCSRWASERTIFDDSTLAMRFAAAIVERASKDARQRMYYHPGDAPVHCNCGRRTSACAKLYLGAIRAFSEEQEGDAQAIAGLVLSIAEDSTHMKFVPEATARAIELGERQAARDLLRAEKNARLAQLRIA